MQVFSVDFDYNRYQLISTMPGLVEDYPHPTARAPMLCGWRTLTATVDDPTKRRGDFLACGVSYFVCPRSVTVAFSNAVRDVQALPVRLEREAEEFDLWNISTFIDALDVEKTRFKPPPLRSQPLKWEFKSERIDRPMLFRTPQVPTQVLVATGFAGQEGEDFLVTYRRMKWRGLVFDLLWDSGS